MKSLLTKLRFKVASHLYTKHSIVAPQILESNSIVVLPANSSDEDVSFYREKQKEIADRMLNLA